jgi:hypothetical protein
MPFSLDLSDHALTTISTWAEVGILIFMLWEKFGWNLGVPPMIEQAKGSYSVFDSLQANRTQILAIVGLAIVIWLHFRETRSPEIIDGAATPNGAAQILTPPLTNGRDTAIKGSVPTPLSNFDPLKQFTWTDANAAEIEVVVTPEFLMSLYRDKTTIQANAEASMYIGRRIKMHGKVRNIASPGNGTVMVFLETTDGTQISMVFLGEEGKIVSIYAIDQSIYTTCIINEIGKYNLLLYPCKLDDLQR